MVRPVFVVALLMACAIAFVYIGLQFNLDASAWASWVQAIGSITALLVAIYIMDGQNKHARTLLREAEAISIRSRASSVHAIITRAADLAKRAHNVVTKPAPTDSAEMAAYISTIELAKQMVSAATKSLQSIPAHELGSSKLTSGLALLAEVMPKFEAIIDLLLANPANGGNEMSVVAFDMIYGLVVTNVKVFEDAMPASL